MSADQKSACQGSVRVAVATGQIHTAPSRAAFMIRELCSQISVGVIRPRLCLRLWGGRSATDEPALCKVVSQRDDERHQDTYTPVGGGPREHAQQPEKNARSCTFTGFHFFPRSSDHQHLV